MKIIISYEFDGEVIIVPEVYTKEDLDTFQVNENTHRENLKPIEIQENESSKY